MSSRIVNGMIRTVDALKVTGLWEDGDSDAGRSRRRMQETSNRDKEGELSDKGSILAITDDFIYKGGRFCSCRRRRQCRIQIACSKRVLLQSAGSFAAAPGQSSAIIAIQQYSEWLRPLLLILPGSCRRLIDNAASGDNRRNSELDSSDKGKERQQRRVRKSVPLQATRLLCFFVSKIQVQRPQMRLASIRSRDYLKRVLEIIILNEF
jgi:hypothetical protein